MSTTKKGNEQTLLTYTSASGSGIVTMDKKEEEIGGRSVVVNSLKRTRVSVVDLDATTKMPKLANADGEISPREGDGKPEGDVHDNQLDCLNKNQVMQNRALTAPRNGLDALQGCVKALEASVSTSMAQLTQSLSSSAEMMKSMNSMMEEYVKSSLSVSTKISKKPMGKSHLHDAVVAVSISCNGRIPVECLAVRVTLINENDHTLGVLNSDHSFKNEDEEYELGSAVEIVRLSDGESKCWKTAALPNKPWTAVKVTASFPSPGTGKQLCVTVRKPILAWDLFQFEHESTVKAEDDFVKVHFEIKKQLVAKATVSARTAREYFCVNPLSGLELPSRWKSHFHAFRYRSQRIVDEKTPIYAFVRQSGEEVEILFHNHEDRPTEFSQNVLDAARDDLLAVQERLANE